MYENQKIKRKLIGKRIMEEGAKEISFKSSKCTFCDKRNLYNNTVKIPPLDFYNEGKQYTVCQKCFRDIFLPMRDRHSNLF